MVEHAFAFAGSSGSKSTAEQWGYGRPRRTGEETTNQGPGYDDRKYVFTGS